MVEVTEEDADDRMEVWKMRSGNPWQEKAKEEQDE